MPKAQQHSLQQDPGAVLPSLELAEPLEPAGCGWEVEPGEPWRLSEQSCPCQLGLVGDWQGSGAQPFTAVSFSQKIAAPFRGLAWLVLDTHCAREGKSER